METVSRHISYILATQGAVGVPGLGFFHEACLSARYEDGRWFPPCREVCFEAVDVCPGDDIVRSVMLGELVGEDEAHAIIEREVVQLKALISSGEAWAIKGVGELMLDENGIIVLRKDQRTSWMPALEIAEVDTVSEEEKNRIAAEERRRSFQRMLQRTASSAAAVAIFVVVAFVLSQLPNHQSTAQRASLAAENLIPATITVTRPATAIAEPVVAKEKQPTRLIFCAPVDGTAPAKKRRPLAEINDSIKAAASTASVNAKYCLVVGSLASEADAQQFLRDYRNSGFKLQVLKKDGYFRVYALEGQTVESVLANAQNQNVAKRFPSYWVCRK